MALKELNSKPKEIKFSLKNFSLQPTKMKF